MESYVLLGALFKHDSHDIVVANLIFQLLCEVMCAGESKGKEIPAQVSFRLWSLSMHLQENWIEGDNN